MTFVKLIDMFPSEQAKTDVIKFTTTLPLSLPPSVMVLHFLSWTVTLSLSVMSTKPHGKQELTYLLFTRILHSSRIFRRRGKAVHIDNMTSSRHVGGSLISSQRYDQGKIKALRGHSQISYWQWMGWAFDPSRVGQDSRTIFISNCRVGRSCILLCPEDRQSDFCGSRVLWQNIYHIRYTSLLLRGLGLI